MLFLIRSAKLRVFHLWAKFTKLIQVENLPGTETLSIGFNQFSGYLNGSYKFGNYLF